MGNSVSSTINANDSDEHYSYCTHSQFGLSQKSDKSEKGTSRKSADKNSSVFNSGSSPPSAGTANNPEGSRVLFLLYLIHRTWNVVVDTVDPKSKRSRTSQSFYEDSETSVISVADDAPQTISNNCLDEFTNDDAHNIYGSQFLFCSCSHCNGPKSNPLYGRTELRLSICESEVSYRFEHQMVPNMGKFTETSSVQDNTNNGKLIRKTSTDSVIDPQISEPKENQRQPIYNAEDYIGALKKYGQASCNGSANKSKSIYDVQEITVEPTKKNSTLPSPKPPEYNPILLDCETTAKQFSSITDLLTKLRADLRAAFPSFVQEFVATPLDGVGLLLEVLRLIQLSQTMSTIGTPKLQRNSQTNPRRALLDELACLQCLNLCSTRSPETGIRLGASSVGLLPLAAAATGQGIRSRILALQLLTAACDKSALGSQKIVQLGHTSVSEALSTLRLRCGEPVRFRLLVGMLNSSGGTGELQVFGLKFINTFLDSSEDAQNRLYLQAELCQAGFEPANMTKTISSSSPWHQKLREEVKHFDDYKIDIEKLLQQARESDRIQNQMGILERQVKILQEDKNMLTSMERRLQERCADLQREIFRLQGAHRQESYKNIEKVPIALPRHVPPANSKIASSEQDDEGISSSETGPSLSPEPNNVNFAKNPPQKYRLKIKTSNDIEDKNDATIEDVMEELENIVNDVEREISLHSIDTKYKDSLMEKEIVPVNLLPQPPKKSRSLSHFLSSGSEFDGSDYGMLLIHNGSRTSFFDDLDLENEEDKELTDISNSTNRDILNVIMDAREKNNSEDFTKLNKQTAKILKDHIDDDDGKMVAADKLTPAQKFSGVFFMTEMNTAQKYPKPDITAALEARRVTKNLDRMEYYGNGIDSMLDIVTTQPNNLSIDKQLKLNEQIILSNQQKYKNILNNQFNVSQFKWPATPPPTNNGQVIRMSQKCSSSAGSKLTDLASGLY